VWHLLNAIGEDVSREGLKETPARVGRFWRDFIAYDPGKVTTRFEQVHVDQMVVVTGIQVWSLCEHHLLPFSCTITAGYLTTDRVVGLSKIARVCQHRAHALQLQERLVSEIADDLQSITGSASVGVIGTGQHLCMVMRGIRAETTRAITSAMRGCFLTKPEARAELLALHHNGQ
jgi:GTP cyclohydrolase I